MRTRCRGRSCPRRRPARPSSGRCGMERGSFAASGASTVPRSAAADVRWRAGQFRQLTFRGGSKTGGNHWLRIRRIAHRRNGGADQQVESVYCTRFFAVLQEGDSRHFRWHALSRAPGAPACGSRVGEGRTSAAHAHSLEAQSCHPMSHPAQVEHVAALSGGIFDAAFRRRGTFVIRLADLLRGCPRRRSCQTCRPSASRSAV